MSLVVLTSGPQAVKQNSIFPSTTHLSYGYICGQNQSHFMFWAQTDWKVFLKVVILQNISRQEVS